MDPGSKRLGQQSFEIHDFSVRLIAFVSRLASIVGADVSARRRCKFFVSLGCLTPNMFIFEFSKHLSLRFVRSRIEMHCLFNLVLHLKLHTSWISCTDL